MALIKILKNRVPLDNKYENPILFKNVKNGFTNTDLLTSLTPLEFLSKYDSSVNDISTYIRVNFRYGNTLNTRVVVNLSFLTPDEASSIYDCNYVIVRQEENAKLPYILFYFINNMSFEKGATTIVLDLELDIFTTFNKWSLNTSEVNTTRQHVDRFKNETSFNCEEALLPDLIDGQFKANIIKTSTNYTSSENTFLMVYLSINTPRYELSNLSYANDKYRLLKTGTEITSNIYNTFKDLVLPYAIGFVPLKSDKVKLVGGVYNANLYLLNSNLTKALIDNPYVLSIQVVNFKEPFVKEILSDNTNYQVSILEENNPGQSSPYKEILPLVLISSQEISSLIQETTYKTEQEHLIFSFYNFYIRDELPLLKDYRLEPKLYTAPYAFCTISGACYKDYEIEILGVNKYLDITEIFIPSPLTNGNYYSIESGIYKNTRKNYLVMSPYLTSEIPVIDNKYKEFLATQKNSYAQGVTMSYFNNLLGIGTGVTSAFIGNREKSSIGVASGVMETIQSATKLIATPFAVSSKIADLKGTPSKITSSNYDIYSVVGITDTTIKLNFITMLDVELQKVFNYYYMFGYQVERKTKPYLTSDNLTINTSDYIKKPTLFNRKIFNYVQLNQDITNELVSPIGLSQAIRNKFNSILNRGCRFWNVTQDTKYLDFSYENYESNKEGH